MRRIKKRYIIIPLVLAGLAALCIIRWHAWFGLPPEPKWDGPKRDYVFPRFEQDQTPEYLDFLVLGDIHNRLTQQDYDLLAQRVPQADAILQTGDWLERGQDYYYQSLLREWWPSLLYDMPVIAAPGNHEYSKGIIKSCSEVWEYAFPVGDNGPKGVPGHTYYVDYPQLRLIVMDTNPYWRIMHYTRTLTWLHKTMDEADGRYVVVLMHHPVLSAAKGRFNLFLYLVFRHVLGEADLVLAGHDHSYMRKGSFVVMNTGGKPKEQKTDSVDAQTTSPVYGVLSVQLSAFKDHQLPLEFRIYRLNDGQMIDSLYVNHD